MHERGILAETLYAHCDLADIKLYCFDLGVEFEDLKGPEKKIVIRSLIAHVCNTKKLTEFEAYLRAKRSEIDWDEIKWSDICTYHSHTPRSATLILEGEYSDFNRDQLRLKSDYHEI